MGFKPMTSGTGILRSIQLSYGAKYTLACAHIRGASEKWVQSYKNNFIFMHKISKIMLFNDKKQLCSIFFYIFARELCKDDSL